MLRQAWQEKANWELMRNAWLGEMFSSSHGFIFAEKGKKGTTEGHHHCHHHRHLNLDNDYGNDDARVDCDGDNDCTANDDDDDGGDAIDDDDADHAND
eukprot:2683052-Karenia_brevis.AAC.1